MKNLLLSSALVLSTATFATADSHTQIMMQVENELSTMAMDVDIESLTEEQISELYQVLSSSDSAGDKTSAVRAVLNDFNVVIEDDNDPELTLMVPRSQLRSLVYAQRGDLGVDGMRIRTLTDEQLAALFLIASGSASDKQVQAQAIVN